MKKIILRISLMMVILLTSVAPVFAAEPATGAYSPEMQILVDQLKKLTDEKTQVDKNLVTFDELDYVVFSNQQWTRLHESHAKDVIVNWPDGHKTYGID